MTTRAPGTRASGGNRSGTRRSFGNVRRLPSGRLQARYKGPDGLDHRAPVTFDTKGAADAWLSTQRAAITVGTWRSPEEVHHEVVTAAQEQHHRATLTLGEYAPEVLARRNLRDTTRELYGKLLRAAILPTFGALPLADITPRRVSTWYASMAATPTKQANAYGLLKSILKDAVEDEVIERNPCKVKGGSQKTRAREPEALTPAELVAYLQAAPEHYRVPLMLAGWCALRSGEVRGLRRRDLDLDSGVVHVEQQAVKVGARNLITKPKTAAGLRGVAIPPPLLPGLRSWLGAHPATGPDELLFTSADGGRSPMSASSLRDAHVVARAAIGKPSLTVHGLRHTGLTLAAQAGATIGELMARAGHTTPTMALRYQHAAGERDQEIAARLGVMAQFV